MTQIKLPWRRFGDERPDAEKEVLVWGPGEFTPMAAVFVSVPRCPGEWVARYSDASWDAFPEDRWIYLSEIENPFEEEGHDKD